jgi:hypothetical protein
VGWQRAKPSASGHYQRQKAHEAVGLGKQRRQCGALAAGSCVLLGWLRLVLLHSQVLQMVKIYYYFTRFSRRLGAVGAPLLGLVCPSVTVD